MEITLLFFYERARNRILLYLFRALVYLGDLRITVEAFDLVLRDVPVASEYLYRLVGGLNRGTARHVFRHGGKNRVYPPLIEVPGRLVGE